MLTKAQENRIFLEAKRGYGFVQIIHTVDGTYCTGCLCIHKRPTKMYNNGRDIMCKTAIVHFYNPEDI